MSATLLPSRMTLQFALSMPFLHLHEDRFEVLKIYGLKIPDSIGNSHLPWGDGSALEGMFCTAEYLLPTFRIHMVLYNRLELQFQVIWCLLLDSLSARHTDDAHTQTYKTNKCKFFKKFIFSLPLLPDLSQLTPNSCFHNVSECFYTCCFILFVIIVSIFTCVWEKDY